MNCKYGGFCRTGSGLVCEIDGIKFRGFKTESLTSLVKPLIRALQGIGYMPEARAGSELRNPFYLCELASEKLFIIISPSSFDRLVAASTALIRVVRKPPLSRVASPEIAVPPGEVTLSFS